MSDLDNRFLRESQQFENKIKSRQLLYFLTPFLLSIIGLGVGGVSPYTFCFTDQKLINKTQENCFRKVITSGGKNTWISSTNFNLDQGIKTFEEGKKYFKRNDKRAKNYYQKAKIFFELAAKSDPEDPIIDIFLSNTEARLNSLKNQGESPFKLAVFVQIYYYEERAIAILQGVKKAQSEFNKMGGKNGRLLEIVVVNEGKTKTVAQNVAKEIANQKDILGIIRHFTSEMSDAAICVYQDQKKGKYVVDDWRETSGYDATQIFIEGLRSIENNDDINRKTMLTFLENQKQEVDKSIKWKEERSVIARNYCSVKLTDSGFELID